MRILPTTWKLKKSLKMQMQWACELLYRFKTRSLKKMYIFGRFSRKFRKGYFLNGHPLGPIMQFMRNFLKACCFKYSSFQGRLTVYSPSREGRGIFEIWRATKFVILTNWFSLIILFKKIEIRSKNLKFKCCSIKMRPL